MGMIAKVLSFTRVVRNNAKISDVKVDSGGGANITSEHFSSAGDDAYPLSSDYVIIADRLGSGRKDAIGYADPINAPKANAGDKRIYSRNASTGVLAAEIWLKNDKSIVVENSLGTIELKNDGSIDMNGVTIDILGNMHVPLNLTVGPLSKDFLTHIHVGSPTAPVGAISPTGVIV